jgi:hypothetical protein
LAEQSIGALRQAIADGYVNLNSIKKDPDLDVLRSSDEFKALVQDVAGKAVSKK